MSDELDYLFKNGIVIDGSNSRAIKANVGIKNSKIAYVGLDPMTKAKEVIDIKRLVICPGFIDIHSHSDMSIPFDGRLESMLRQGVTTSVVGNCGSSLAPINDNTIELMQKELDTFSPRGLSVNINWHTFSEYLDILDKSKIAMNIIPLIGYGTVRIASGPAYEDRIPTDEEFDAMKDDVIEAMEAGAFGLSTGLFYAPQIFASTEEITEVTKAIASYGGIYASHIRSEGETVVEAVKELIKIVQKSGCRHGHISHHKIAGKAYWGLSETTLKIIDEANRYGLSITCDQYPYNRGMTSLIALLPPWVHEGGVDNILYHIDTDESRIEIERDVYSGIEGWENIIKEDGWKNIYIASVKTDKWDGIQGKSLHQIATENDYDDRFQLLYDILLDEAGETTMTIKSMGEDDIKRIMRNKYTAIGSDGWGIAPTDMFILEKPHPRSYGTFPKVLGEYVREKRVLDLKTAIYKMTGFPADILNVKRLGRIRQGFNADLVVFDSRTINDRATYLNPHQFPIGIKYVMVNGKFVVEDNNQHDIYAGKVIRRNGKL